MTPIVVDTETTGTEERDQIVELAARWRGTGGSLSSYNQLANPGMPIPPEAMAVHHITDESVRFCPPSSEIVTEFCLFIMRLANPVMVAHNAEFDRGMIERAGLPRLPWVCTWRCALHIWPDAPGHGNQVLRYWLGLEPEVPADLYPHRALYDVIVTEAILARMLQERTLEQLIDMSGRPAVLRKIRFGKHRGQLWAELPRDYLQWIARQPDMDADSRHTAMHYLRPQGQLI